MLKTLKQYHKKGVDSAVYEKIAILEAKGEDATPLHAALTEDAFLSFTQVELLEFFRKHGLLLEDQIIRHGEAMTLVSAVHHQRNAPCFIYIYLDKKGTPYRVIALAANHEYIPRRDVIPFDCFVDLGKELAIKYEDDREMFAQSAFSYASFLDIFDAWVEKCELGFSAIGEKRKFLPIFIDTDQFLAALSLWPDGLLEDWASRPYRFIESSIAYENDRAWMRNTQLLFGKNTFKQWAAKIGFEVERGERGLPVLDKVARTYSRVLGHNFV